MAELQKRGSFPWDDIEGDRLYSSDDFAKFYEDLFTSGVVATIGDALRVSEDSGMNVIVKTGTAIIKGRQFYNGESYQLTIPVASIKQDRTDSIVVKMDIAARTIELLVKQGNTSVERSENIFELQLATVQVKKNSSSITDANIKDTRADESVCGYSTPYEKLSVSGLESQYEAMLEEIYNQFVENSNNNKVNLNKLLSEQQVIFQEWFESLQTNLTGEAAANLQSQIDELMPNHEQLIIKHDLKRYPSVRCLYWEYGLGLVPLGHEPSGKFGGNNVIEFDCRQEYLNSKEVKVFVPSKYALTTPTVIESNKHEYLLTDGYKSIQINLGGK